MTIWVNNDIDEKLVDEDKVPTGYKKGRLKKQKTIDKLVGRISKQELFDFYIIQNHNYIETMERFSISVRGHLR